MGTKRNPSTFDCYAKAEPDEPLFVLLGRDPMAGLTVAVWRRLRDGLCRMGPHNLQDAEQIEEAEAVMRAMEMYARDKGKDLQRAQEIFEDMILDCAAMIHAERAKA